MGKEGRNVKKKVANTDEYCQKFSSEKDWGEEKKKKVEGEGGGGGGGPRRGRRKR